MKTKLEKIKDLEKYIKECKSCSLCEEGGPPVLYRGNPESSLLLVGEGLGKIEQEQQKPFTGPAGQLLDKIMAAIDLDTNKDMILTNSILCRPVAPKGSGRQNLSPPEESLKKCRQYLDEFIEIIDPKVIVACGRTALCQLLRNPKLKMRDYEGKWANYIYKQIPIFIMTHPASILHLSKWPDKQIEKKQKVWNYIQQFKEGLSQNNEQKI
jgi:uracil-DNA glycosylase